jgi:Ca2+-binding RTX toxin-like protein
LAFTVDTKAPTVGITLSDSQLTPGETATVSFSFSEAVSGFDMNDVTATNGTLSGLTSTNGKLWTATYTPNVGMLASVNSIAVGSDYTDAAGNTGSSGTSANFTIDTRRFINGTDGNDTLAGSADADIISGVPASTTLYGRGSIDTLTGNGGHDVFVLGVTGRVFYDDGLAKKSGTNDYALITDFTAGVDKIQLASGKSYLYVAGSYAGTLGVGVVWDTNANGKVDSNSDELIAVLVGATAVSQSDVVMV